MAAPDLPLLTFADAAAFEAWLAAQPADAAGARSDGVTRTAERLARGGTIHPRGAKR